jgi:hypothetical protein
MITTWWLAVMLSVAGQTAASKAVTLPDTPQGRHVQAYVDAFNSGDEAAFVKVHTEHMIPDVTQKRSAEQMGNMFKRMRGDFGTLRVEQVLGVTATQMQIVVPTKDGARGTFTFSFESAKPYRISGIDVNVGPGGA